MSSVPAIKGVRSTPDFKKLLKKWLEIIQEFGEWGQWENWKYCCWSHRERPALGILAGAAWRIGGVVLHEWETNKVGRNDSKIFYAHHSLSQPTYLFRRELGVLCRLSGQFENSSPVFHGSETRA